MLALGVTLEAAREDEAVAVLWDHGTCGVEVKPAPSGAVQLLAYFERDPDLEALRRALPGAEIASVPVPEVDWVARFREGFRAFRVGRFLVTPRWEAGDALGRCAASSIPAAPSARARTRRRGCASRPSRSWPRRRPLGRTLDLGSGTGLLAVAAWRLGAGPVVASDLDPEATAASRLHARLNGAPLQVVRADGGAAFRAGSFDLVLANLMALLLVDRAAEIAALRRTGRRAGDLRPARRRRARPCAPPTPLCGAPLERTQGEWAALVFEVRAP